MKKLCYILLVIILWTMLSLAWHLILWSSVSEIASDSLLQWYSQLPSEFRYSIPLLGLMLGYYVGQRRWRIVYIEKRHWKDLRNMWMHKQ